MNTRRIAVNRLIVDGEAVIQCVVELDGDGNVARWWHFDEEQPFTEWVGGTLEIVKIPDGGYRIKA